MKTVNANGWTDATAVLAAAAHEAAEDVIVEVRNDKGSLIGKLYYSKDGGWFTAFVNGCKKVFFMTWGWMVRFGCWVAGLFASKKKAEAMSGAKMSEGADDRKASGVVIDVPVTNPGKHKRQAQAV